MPPLPEDPLAARSVVLLALVTLIAAEVRAAELHAERITERSAPALRIGGPDAIGGVGDWYLANDVVEVIVDDPARAHAKLDHGGTIVDAGLRDRTGEDQFARLFPLLNLDQRVLVNYDTIRAQVNRDEGWARLVVSSRRGASSVIRGSAWRRRLDLFVPDGEAIRDVVVETEYAVFRGEPFVHITTTVRNRGDRPAPIFAYGDVWMRGGRSMRSFVGNTIEPERSRGFHHVSFDRNALLAAGDAMAAFTHVSVPGVRHLPPIAYALFSPERAAAGYVQYGVTGVHVNLVNVFSVDSRGSKLGLLRLLRATRRELPPGESFTYVRRLLIVGHPDTASTTDVMFPLLGYADGTSGIEGRVEPADLPCAVHVDAAETGAPVTQILTRTEGPRAGRYRAVLPPGEYALTLRAPQREPRRLRAVVSPGAFATLPAERFEEPAWLVFDPAFQGGEPGRIVVEGIGGTPDPVFGAELLDFRLDGETPPSGSETRELHFVGSPRDPARVAIAPGRYRLTAARGLEHGALQRELELPGPGAELRVEPFVLPRYAELPGFVSADLHVHSQASDDSAMSNEARLASFVADGVDVMVTTDHDHLGHFEPALDALGVRGRIRVVQGVEVTSSAPSPAAPWTLGHHNAWPVRYRPWEHRQGAPPSQNLSLAELYARLRDDYGARVVQMNHPKRDGASGVTDQSFLTHLGSAGEGYDPTRPIGEFPNRLLLERSSDGGTRAIDFDAIELMNGADFEQYRAVRADWISLLRQGFRRTGTANSDTHGPGSPAGYPRNYVDLGRRFDARDFDEAIRAGHLFGTTGPLVASFRANGAGMGDEVSAQDGRVDVRVRVVAAPWVPVEEVRLLANGDVVRAFRDLPPEDGSAVVRLDERIPLELERDAFLTLEAGAPVDADAETWSEGRAGAYAALAPGFVSAAFTNPIFVDVDGGGFDPPGLPPRPRRWGAAAGVLGLAAVLAVAIWLRRT